MRGHALVCAANAVSLLFQDRLSATQERQLRVSAGQIESHTLLHRDRQGAVQSLGSVWVRVPGDLAGRSPAEAETQGPCYISQLVLFRKNPYPRGRAPGQVPYAGDPSLPMSTSVGQGSPLDDEEREGSRGMFRSGPRAGPLECAVGSSFLGRSF